MMPRTLRHVTNSKRPITQPADLQGLKIRVPQNDLWVKFFKSLGANPTPMDFTEVYTALQLKVIDGQENPIEVPVANKFQEVQKYLSLTGHIADAYILAMSQKKFQGLSAECQKLLQETAVETAQFKADFDQKEADKALEQLKSGGMEVNELAPEQQQAFQEAAQKLYPEFESLIGAEFVNETLQFAGKA
jgi:TRAP-type C4-dicarboxylate transport system substrate-binding protein